MMCLLVRPPVAVVLPVVMPILTVRAVTLGIVLMSVALEAITRGLLGNLPVRVVTLSTFTNVVRVTIPNPMPALLRQPIRLKPRILGGKSSVLAPPPY